MILLYQDKCFFNKMNGCIPVSHFVCWVLFHAFLLSVFFNQLFKKSSTEEHPHIVKQFGSRSVQQKRWPDLDQSCFLQR